MTTSIIISDITIHQDAEGRYSLNDLHKASGGEQRHRPKYWLDLTQTKELIDEIIKGEIAPFNPNEEIINSEISLFAPTETKRGCRGGTYVCKELVYSYAMWISPSFSLKVIRVYDALVADQKKISFLLPHSLDYQFLTTVSDGQVTHVRMAKPGEIFASFDYFQEMAKRAGYLIIHSDEIKNMTLESIVKAGENAKILSNKFLKN